MVFIKSAFLASLLVALVAAGPAPRSNMVVRASKSEVPSGFVKLASAPAGQTIPLRIALVQNNIAGLEKALYDVSTPSSANYGKHLSKEDVESYVKPAQASVDAVNAFLKSNGISATTLSPAGDWIGFSLPVSQANDMFAADFTVYNNMQTGVKAIRTLSYSIPSSLQGHLDLVHPTTNLGSPLLPLKVTKANHNGTATGAGGSKRAADVDCSTITPACLQGTYGLPTAAATQSSNAIGVAGFLGQNAEQADLTSFLGALRPDLSSGTTFALKTLDGGSNPQGPNYAGVEANLDIQYTVGVAQGVPVAFIAAGSDNSDGFDGFLDMANYVLTLDPVPNVLTTSYAFNEPGLDPGSANNLCNAYMQLGARGTSVFFASGDGGVSGTQSSTCTTFVPTFPSTCPYVTSVGGTTGTPETAAGLSGGGFSTIFAVPSYQTDVVASYVSGLGSTYSGLYNATGRGFPDIAAFAESVEIFNSGTAELVAGTSCATPIFASTIALLNDQLIGAGKSPLGFLNPFLYSNPSALNDITSGTNPGCNTNGFSAGTGWDPVTGLGSPKYAALSSAAGL
ncbi:family S53 protease-like protein [Athelia psychrophila]|uniref:Family S53 protease-like protein n=1 Tax=Athelia psychrophila TaxID=1759441 RepID=A0A166EDJ3_9AGAM|nr:family S53 protease-like protein [Fibularhizoctonia sp. CBS 109695]